MNIIHDQSSQEHSSSEINSTASDSVSKTDVIYENTDLEKLFTNKETCYYIMINNFFKNECSKENIDKMIAIINSESDISLRILDWFVTKYSKKHANFDGVDESFDVRISYKAQLKSYRKKYFDPFRRRKKFFYNFEREDIGKKILTTLGQLNFFRWAINKNILKFVESNLNIIITEMNQIYKNDKHKKKKKSSKKGQVNLNVKRTIENDEMKIVLRFD
jgi:hypothetical protein